MGFGAGGEVWAWPGRSDVGRDVGWWGDWVGSRDVDPALSLAVAGSGAASGPGRPCSPSVPRDPGIFGLSRPAHCDPGQSKAAATYKGFRPPGCGSNRPAADSGPAHREQSGIGGRGAKWNLVWRVLAATAMQSMYAVLAMQAMVTAIAVAAMRRGRRMPYWLDADNHAIKSLCYWLYDRSRDGWARRSRRSTPRPIPW